ncbi:MULTISPECIES: hypothetical protein [Pseudomonadota]|uniref:hypothetical protein n=1 Tax=Pseudomonadota TaxID=1224 RepID=UPI00178C7856|nr:MULTISPECIES: hypothetical protein [Pseudomonadota]MCR1299828.1 hypothetical protein [Enterobacter kobei]HCB1588460.1 hypothetical protein [Citrobacter freundii]HEE9906715.1 hypothetical protein [Citrobacter freundii]
MSAATLSDTPGLLSTTPTATPTDHRQRGAPIRPIFGLTVGSVPVKRLAAEQRGNARSQP